MPKKNKNNKAKGKNSNLNQKEYLKYKQLLEKDLQKFSSMSVEKLLQYTDSNNLNDLTNVMLLNMALYNKFMSFAIFGDMYLGLLDEMRNDYVEYCTKGVQMVQDTKNNLKNIYQIPNINDTKICVSVPIASTNQKGFLYQLFSSLLMNTENIEDIPDIVTSIFANHIHHCEVILQQEYLEIAKRIVKVKKALEDFTIVRNSVVEKFLLPYSIASDQNSFLFIHHLLAKNPWILQREDIANNIKQLQAIFSSNEKYTIKEIVKKEIIEDKLIKCNTDYPLNPQDKAKVLAYFAENHLELTAIISEVHNKAECKIRNLSVTENMINFYNKIQKSDADVFMDELSSMMITTRSLDLLFKVFIEAMNDKLIMDGIVYTNLINKKEIPLEIQKNNEKFYRNALTFSEALYFYIENLGKESISSEYIEKYKILHSFLYYIYQVDEYNHDQQLAFLINDITNNSDEESNYNYLIKIRANPDCSAGENLIEMQNFILRYFHGVDDDSDSETSDYEDYDEEEYEDEEYEDDTIQTDSDIDQDNDLTHTNNHNISPELINKALKSAELLQGNRKLLKEVLEEQSKIQQQKEEKKIQKEQAALKVKQEKELKQKKQQEKNQKKIEEINLKAKQEKELREQKRQEEERKKTAEQKKNQELLREIEQSNKIAALEKQELKQEKLKNSPEKKKQNNNSNSLETSPQHILKIKDNAALIMKGETEVYGVIESKILTELTPDEGKKFENALKNGLVPSKTNCNGVKKLKWCDDLLELKVATLDIRILCTNIVQDSENNKIYYFDKFCVNHEQLKNEARNIGSAHTIKVNKLPLEDIIALPTIDIFSDNENNNQEALYPVGAEINDDISGETSLALYYSDLQ